MTIWNTDPDNSITIKSAQSYDTDGNLVTDYVPEPLELAPLGTTNLVLEQTDDRGGVGVNFIVDWAAKTETLEPVIEAIMISTAGMQDLGFPSPGWIISQTP